MSRLTLACSVVMASVVILGAASMSQAAGLSSYVRGAVIEYGYGPGTSSSRPRVEMQVALCASGQYRTQGRSCRPNIIAKGYQCSKFTDAGNWRVSGNQLQWMSFNGQPGSLQLYRRGNGYSDGSGNRVRRVGNAGC